MIKNFLVYDDVSDLYINPNQLRDPKMIQEGGETDYLSIPQIQ